MSVCVVFFSHRTADEVRIDDLISVVCASDLISFKRYVEPNTVLNSSEYRILPHTNADRKLAKALPTSSTSCRHNQIGSRNHDCVLVCKETRLKNKIGRASCRERVCQYV